MSMSVAVIRGDSLPATPWKNGGGETREIACFPPGSSLGEFEWRLSTATVAQDGAFSIFEGIDRRLYVLDGAGLELRMGSDQTCRLATGEHIDFRGEVPVHGRLISGPVVDFNIMVRRDKQRAHIEERTIAGEETLDLPWQTTAIFVRHGLLRIKHAASDFVANARDTIMLDNGHAASVLISGPADIILIGFDPL